MCILQGLILGEVISAVSSIYAFVMLPSFDTEVLDFFGYLPFLPIHLISPGMYCQRWKGQTRALLYNGHYTPSKVAQ